MRGSYTSRYFPILPDTEPRMAPPDTWNYSDARERVKTESWLASHRLFAEGDHLQVSGNVTGIPGLVRGALAGWIAPMPPPGYQYYQNHVDGVIRGFVSANKIGEVRQRHTSGVVGRQPSKGFESREPIQEGKEMSFDLRRRKEQSDTWMAARWEAEGMHGSLQRAVGELLVYERQPARMLLPRAYLVEGTDGTRRIPKAKLPDMIGMLRLTYPKPEDCTVWTDPDTFEQIGIFTYRTPEGEDRAEVTWVDRDTKLTCVRQIGSNGAGDSEVRYDFGGMIPMFEMRRSPLITPQMIQNNKALNLALSSVPANVYTAMMRTRTFMNVDPPGKEVLNEAGERVFVPDAVEFGRTVANFLQGAPIYDKERLDANGNPIVIDYANPSMQVEEPVEVSPSRDAVQIHEYQILAEANQLHALISGDSTATGVARIQARADFVDSLMRTKPTVDACVEWQMDIRLAMAEAFTAGREGQTINRVYSGSLRANAECKLNPGPISPEERAALDAMVQSGRLSDETALILMGVEDVTEEKARKNRDNHAKRVFELIREADDTGMDRYAVLTLLGGLPENEARALARGDVTAGGLTQ